MPDFPSRKGPTLAEIEASAILAKAAAQTSIETKVDGVKTKTDPLPADPASESGAIKTETAAIKAKTDPLPAAPAPADEYDTEMARLDVDLSSRSEHDPAAIWTEASRALTTPADYKANVSALALESGGKLDKIPGYEAPVEASILMIMDTEVNLVEKTDNKIGILDGYVDLTPMAAEDTVVIRQSMQIKAEGAYVQYAEDTYSDVQTLNPLLHIITKTAKDKIKVTAEQTAGAVKTFDVQFYRRLQA
ncbi:hypothetical protein ES703_69907 [subsurface metagenome]